MRSKKSCFNFSKTLRVENFYCTYRSFIKKREKFIWLGDGHRSVARKIKDQAGSRLSKTFKLRFMFLNTNSFESEYRETFLRARKFFFISFFFPFRHCRFVVFLFLRRNARGLQIGENSPISTHKRYHRNIEKTAASNNNNAKYLCPENLERPL